MSQQFSHIEGKLPPQALEFEEVLLGALMLESDCHDQVIPMLQADAFYMREHNHVFKAIKALYAERRGIDLLTVTQQLTKMGALDYAGGAYFVAKLTDRVTSSANAVEHTLVLKELWMKRQLITLSHRCLDAAYDGMTDVFSIIDAMKKNMNDIDQAVVQHLPTKDFSDVIDLSITQMGTRMEQAKSGRLTGVPTPLTALNKHTGGWQPGDVTVLAGRPSMGKTAFALNVAKTAAQAGYHVVFPSLEMGMISLANRLILSETEVNAKDFQQGLLAPNDLEQIRVAATRLRPLPIHIYDNVMTFSGIASRARIRKRNNECGLIIIDYLQLMEGESGRYSNREQEISKISRQCKQLAKELDVPLLLLSQLNRSVETRGGTKRPQLSDLRESGAIEQDADNVIFIHRDAYYGISDESGLNMEDKGELIIAKGRNIGLIDVPFQHNANITRFWDLGDNSFASGMRPNNSFLGHGGGH